MNLYQHSSKNYYCGIDISNLKFIGQGHQGKVYFLPLDKVIKVFNKANSCRTIPLRFNYNLLLIVLKNQG